MGFRACSSFAAFVSAAEWEDFGIAPLEALDRGAVLVCAPAGGPFPQVNYSSLAVETFGRPSFTLFKIQKATPATPALSVDYEGTTYWLAKSDMDDRSMHVMSLLTQVLGLQNKGTDLPTTANVRVVQ